MHNKVVYASGLKNVVVKVEETCDGTMIPRLIPQAKGFTEELSSTWTVNQVFSVTRSREGVIRRVCVKYCYRLRYLVRAVQSLVILLNIEDSYVLHDIAEVEMMIVKLQKSKIEKIRTKFDADFSHTYERNFQ